jgi:SAM-dependent methyltransferase
VVTDAQRARTLERFEAHRRAWRDNAALRTLYGDWYGRVRAQLPGAGLGPFVELGSGPGFARGFIPELQLSDVVRAPWHDHEISAEALPFGDGSVGALVLFDVLHHLATPAAFFAEATRALAAGGRVILCEPYLSPLSYPVYRWLHEEPVVLGVDPLAPLGPDDEGPAGGTNSGNKDPFDANQAIPTLLFARARGRAAFTRRFPRLAIRGVDRFAGLTYPSSGGFTHAPFLPGSPWRALRAIEGVLPEWLFRAIGFRFLIVLEKR